MQDLKVISFGGSIIVPGEIDVEFLSRFYQLTTTYLKEDPQRRLILVCGGGATARKYQTGFRETAARLNLTNITHAQLDWIGIAATRLNCELLRQLFSSYCNDEVVYDPTGDFQFSGQVLIASGWKPGFSTDYDAVLLAERYRANEMICLSNIPKVYTADPKLDPTAQPLDAIGWDDFKQLVGDEWTPGKNTPLDPAATRRAAELKLKVIMAGGRDLDNIDKILRNQSFVGTIIGPI